jgi:hypothetical protein
MIRLLIARLPGHKRNRITVDVSDSSKGAKRCLRKLGFKRYGNPDVMEFRLPGYRNPRRSATQHDVASVSSEQVPSDPASSGTPTGGLQQASPPQDVSPATAAEKDNQSEQTTPSCACG